MPAKKKERKTNKSKPKQTSIEDSDSNTFENDMEVRSNADDNMLEFNIAAADNDDEHGNRAKVEYLIRYEQMIRQQDAEVMSTVAHLRPLFDKLCRLSGSNSNAAPYNERLSSESLKYSYTVLRPPSQGGSTIEHQEPMKCLTFADMERALKIIQQDYNNDNIIIDAVELLKTDEQLLMVLRELVQCTSAHGSSERTRAERGILLDGLTFPEFLQCYRIVVGGMQTLEILPLPDRTRHLVRYLRNATSARVVHMVHTFAGVDESTFPHAVHSVPSVASTQLSEDYGEGAARMVDVTPNTKRQAQTSNGSNNMSSQELRSILTVKDRQFVQLLDNHHKEMDGMARSVKQLKKVHAKRQTRLTLALLICWILSVIFLVRYQSRTNLQFRFLEDHIEIPPIQGSPALDETLSELQRQTIRASPQQIQVLHDYITNTTLSLQSMEVSVQSYRKIVQDMTKEKERLTKDYHVTQQQLTSKAERIKLVETERDHVKAESSLYMTRITKCDTKLNLAYAELDSQQESCTRQKDTLSAKFKRQFDDAAATHETKEADLRLKIKAMQESSNAVSLNAEEQDIIPKSTPERHKGVLYNIRKHLIPAAVGSAIGLAAPYLGKLLHFILQVLLKR